MTISVEITTKIITSGWSNQINLYYNFDEKKSFFFDVRKCKLINEMLDSKFPENLIQSEKDWMFLPKIIYVYSFTFTIEYQQTYANFQKNRR